MVSRFRQQERWKQHFPCAPKTYYILSDAWHKKCRKDFKYTLQLKTNDLQGILTEKDKVWDLVVGMWGEKSIVPSKTHITSCPCWKLYDTIGCHFTCGVVWMIFWKRKWGCFIYSKLEREECHIVFINLMFSPFPIFKFIYIDIFYFLLCIPFLTLVPCFSYFSYQD